MNQDNEPQPTDDAPTAAPAFSAAPTPEDGSDAGIPIARKSRRGPVLAIVVATASVVCIGGLGTAAIAVLTEPAASTTSSQSTSGGVGTQRGSGYGSFSDPNGNGFSGRGGAAFGGGISGGSSSSGTGASVSAATASTAAEKVGVVTIDTVLNYDSQERAAGTGMIMSSNGLILTNNHVVQQATRITVTVESTGKSYRATVVGTDATDDVAVLKLSGASGLTPVTFDASSSVKAGAAVYSVGNAEGTGDLVTAKGTVEAVNQSLTVQSDFSETGESLSGLIEVSSDVVSGDSGGPLRDSSGDVIGIITAASSGSSAVTGYAINIDKALRIADQIESGTASSTVRIGYPAFLGVEIATTATSTVAGVPVSSVFAGMPAARAGITAGSTITAVDGTAVSTQSALSSAIAAHHVGDRVTIAWTDAKGAAHTATVTLVAGPAA